MTRPRLDDLPDVFPLWPDAGRFLGLGRNSTFAAAQRGEIPTLRFGRRLVVTKRALERLLDEGQLPSAEAVQQPRLLQRFGGGR
jgi:hypothetical protein